MTNIYLEKIAGQISKGLRAAVNELPGDSKALVKAHWGKSTEGEKRLGLFAAKKAQGKGVGFPDMVNKYVEVAKRSLNKQADFVRPLENLVKRTKALEAGVLSRERKVNMGLSSKAPISGLQKLKKLQEMGNRGAYA